MLDAGLLALERQGRHRYYRIASGSVASVIESMMSLSGELNAAASRRSRPISTGPRDRALRRARLCYDHLAGELAVAIADRLIEQGHLDFGQDGGVVTAKGVQFLASLGVHLRARSSRASERSAFCRPCLDWSERRPHVAGVVGRALYDGFVRHGWLRPSEGRAIFITPVGASALNRYFHLAREVP
jgi:hypothetical protein